MDGLTPKQLARSFRHCYKSDVQFAVLMGASRMILKAGMHAFMCRGSMRSRNLSLDSETATISANYLLKSLGLSYKKK